MKVFITTAIAMFIFAGCNTFDDRGAVGSENTVSGNGSKAVAEPNPSANESKETPAPAAIPASGGIETVYSDLAENKCKTVDSNDDEAWSVQSCGGVAGYDLLVSEGDLRQTIDVVSPDKKKHELNFWTVVSVGFSTVGDKAEWRVKKVNGKVEPFALIVRYNVSENPENADEVTSYLTVSKITPTGVCVTDVVKPVKNANQIARDLADASAGKPCMKKRS